jgi:hypothetical protein
MVAVCFFAYVPVQNLDPLRITSTMVHWRSESVMSFGVSIIIFFSFIISLFGGQRLVCYCIRQLRAMFGIIIQVFSSKMLKLNHD